MDLAAFKNVMAIGVLLNSALYLNGAFVAGLVTGNPWAWRLALAAFGATYVSYLLHFCGTDRNRLGAWAPWVVWLSIALGAGAGLALLIW